MDRGANMVNKGLNDWWMQRISASLISVFALPVLVMWFGGWLLDDNDWYLFLSSTLGQILTVIGIVGFALHSRIGLWVVITDYIPRSYQKLVVGLINTWLLALVIWALYLVWII